MGNEDDLIDEDADFDDDDYDADSWGSADYSKAALSVVTCVSTLMSSFLAKRTGTAPYPFWNIFRA